jgi:membrane-associated phospholipid phosphatase
VTTQELTGRGLTSSGRASQTNDELGPPSVLVGSARRWTVAAAASWLGFVLIAMLIYLPSVSEEDQDLLAWIALVRSTSLSQVAVGSTWLGSLTPITAAAVLLALIILWRGRRLFEPIALLLAFMFTDNLVDPLKLALGRVRPPTTVLIGTPVTDYSFPSGHAASGALTFLLGGCLVAGLVRRPGSRRMITIGGTMAAAAIGLSRVYLGYHWFTDVVGGWLLAITVTSTTMLIVIAYRATSSAIDLDVGTVAPSIIRR